ncbi:hypothetical protein M8J75_002503 [Diaphorina citri]|nr:hypothetical protein M8J75_002503 [Diaphorina citri]
MAQVDRQRRVKPGANQAMVPLPINPLQRRDENVAVAVRNITRKPTESKKSTQVLAVVQRPHDQIILTQDDKGKQMVVQRGHNVAKIQRRQRNEHYNPSDLRLRGKQRPIAVGVVGKAYNVSEEDAVLLARQHMQNIQSQRSEQHRPIQQQEEQCLAEEARLRALAKNEKKMKSYRIDMGNTLKDLTNEAANAVQISDNTPELQQGRAVPHRDAARGLHRVHAGIRDSNTGLDNGLLDQIEGYEVHDEYIDDEIYNTDDSGNDVPEESDGNSNGDGGPDNEGDNVMDEQLLLCENNEGNGELEQVPPHGHGNREQTTVAVRKQEKDHRRIDENRLRMLEARQRQQNNMEQILVDTAESRRQEAERKAEEARLKALAINEKKMRSYKVTMGYTLDSAEPGTLSQGMYNDQVPTTSHQQVVPRTSKTPSSVKQENESVVQPKLSKEEREKRRQAEMREKMLAARQRQQSQYERLLAETEETRRREAEKKAEEARQKALLKNEKKMKSYKVTMGYTLEDYLQDSDDEEIKHEYNVPSNANSEQMGATGTTLFQNIAQFSCEFHNVEFLGEAEPQSVSCEANDGVNWGGNELDSCNSGEVSNLNNPQTSTAVVMEGTNVVQSVLKELNLEATERNLMTYVEQEGNVEEEEAELTEEQRCKLYREQMLAAVEKRRAKLGLRK